jgi:hypothetical protein
MSKRKSKKLRLIEQEIKELQEINGGNCYSSVNFKEPEKERKPDFMDGVIDRVQKNYFSPNYWLFGCCFFVGMCIIGFIINNKFLIIFGGISSFGAVNGYKNVRAMNNKWRDKK